MCPEWCSATRGASRLHGNALPLEEAFPVGGQRTDAALGAVRGNRRALYQELQARNPPCSASGSHRTPVGQARFLEFDDHERRAVDEADQIGTAGIERSCDAELAHQQDVASRTLNRLHERSNR